MTKCCCLTLSYKYTIAVCRAACKHIGQKAAHIFLLLLCVSSGLFTSSTSLLPSSFTMYTLTAAAAAVLNTDHRRVVLYAVIGVIWGWAVAGIAFLPYAVYLLLIGSPWVYLPAGVVSLVGTVLPMVGFDRLFYGKWTVRCCSSSSVMTPCSEPPSIGCSGGAALPVLARNMYMEAHGRAAVHLRHFKFHCSHCHESMPSLCMASVHSSRKVLPDGTEYIK